MKKYNNLIVLGVHKQVKKRWLGCERKTPDGEIRQTILQSSNYVPSHESR